MDAQRQHALAARMDPRMHAHVQVNGAEATGNAAARASFTAAGQQHPGLQRMPSTQHSQQTSAQQMQKMQSAAGAHLTASDALAMSLRLSFDSFFTHLNVLLGQSVAAAASPAGVDGSGVSSAPLPSLEEQLRPVYSSYQSLEMLTDQLSLFLSEAEGKLLLEMQQPAASAADLARQQALYAQQQPPPAAPLPPQGALLRAQLEALQTRAREHKADAAAAAAASATAPVAAAMAPSPSGQSTLSSNGAGGTPSTSLLHSSQQASLLTPHTASPLDQRQVITPSQQQALTPSQQSALTPQPTLSPLEPNAQHMQVDG